MSFTSSHRSLSQVAQSENLLSLKLALFRESKIDLNGSQNSKIRAFGKEITNLHHKNGNAQSNDVLLLAKKSQQASNLGKIVPNKVLSKEAKSELISSTRPLKENIPKSSVQVPFTSASDGSLTSDIKLESNMEVEISRKGLCKDLKKEDEKTYEEDFDVRERGNPQYVCEYAATIFKTLREEEKHLASADYMSKQTELNEKMRAILLDWIVDVHLKFKLLDETLFLTVNLIDRYLEKNQVARQKLQLVGITALMIACKYEEIYSPETKDFVYVTDGAYTKEEVLEMEGKMLAALEFKLTTTSAFRFLERYAHVHSAEQRTFMLARYLVELALIEYRMLKYTPSNIATSALYLACKILKKQAWNDRLAKNVQYTEQEIRPCAKDLCVLLQNASRTTLQAVKKKFALAKYMEISKIQLEKH